MKPNPGVVVDEPCIFSADEIFFSTTDARGIITSGNEVFLRISGYTAAELIGRPHNLVRHPDMPRAVFRLLWDFLKTRRPVAALVKNRAKDGRYYWVVALIVPVPDGYLSVRFKPSGEHFALLRGVYARLLAEEQRVRAAGSGENAAMDAAARLLETELQARGFPDYAAFMQTLLCAELKARDTELARTGRRVLRTLPPMRPGTADATARLVSLYGDGVRAYGHLDDLYRRLDDFVTLQVDLERKSDFVHNLTRELRLASMNVALASSRLGGEGLGLGVISGFMGAASVDVAAAVGTLGRGIHTVSERLRIVIFNLAAARLQIEMVMAFVHELIVSPPDAEQRRQRHRLVHTLHLAFTGALGLASTALHDLEANAHRLNATSTDLGRHMLGLQVAQLGGVIESARLVEQEKFSTVFCDIRGQIDRTHQQLAELDDALVRLDAIADVTPAIAREIEETATRMDQDIGALAAA